jgi:flagellar hook-associated protein 3 FlgL
VTINVPSTPGTAWFLEGISNLQTRQTQIQNQITSGYQVQTAADAPGQAQDLVTLGSSLAAAQNYQNNLTRVQAEASTADQALGTAVSLIESARSLAASGANTISTAADRQGLAQQVQSVLQQVVAISNTVTEGRYIFGGDADQVPPYQYDATSVTGVDQLTSSPATRVITGLQGQAVYQSLTAQQIFDPVDNTGQPTPVNAFTALQSLVTALQANNLTGITAATGALSGVSDYLNQQQAYYGASEQRLTSEQTAVADQVTALRTRISSIRDTDITQAATELTQLSTDQAAAYSAEAAIPRKSLFDYLA